MEKNFVMDKNNDSEIKIESMINAKGLNAPRLCPEDIDSVIVGKTYTILPSEKSMVCELILANGFTVRGESACVSKENFDIEIGKKISFENAREKVWMLEGYLLQEGIHQKQKQVFATPSVPLEQPYDDDSDDERHLLGTILLIDDALENVVDIVNVRDFKDIEHRIIFGAMLELRSLRSPCNLTTMTKFLNDRFLWRGKITHAYLTSLTDIVPSRSTIVKLALRIRDKHPSKGCLSPPIDCAEPEHQEISVGELQGKIRQDMEDIAKQVVGSLHRAVNSQYDPGVVGANNLSFGDALSALKGGSKVARDVWNGKGHWLELQVSDTHIKMSFPSAFLKEYSINTPGHSVIWQPSQTDMLADDWMIV
jgi:hypothetical protein